LPKTGGRGGRDMGGACRGWRAADWWGSWAEAVGDALCSRETAGEGAERETLSAPTAGWRAMWALQE
jgi:hypothetical protein